MIEISGEIIAKNFTLPVIFDLVAVFVFGITGALAAVYRAYDFIGLFAMAFVTGVGADSSVTASLFSMVRLLLQPTGAISSLSCYRDSWTFQAK